MKMTAGLAGLLALPALALGGAAEARTLKHTGSGGVELSIEIPDEWVHGVDKSNNLNINNGQPAKVGFSINLSTGVFELDALAAEGLRLAGAAPPTKTGTAGFSKYSGSTYESKLVVQQGEIKLKMMLVRIDETHVVSVTELMFPSAGAADLAAADAVVASIKLTKQ